MTDRITMRFLDPHDRPVILELIPMGDYLKVIESGDDHGVYMARQTFTEYWQTRELRFDTRRNVPVD